MNENNLIEKLIQAVVVDKPLQIGLDKSVISKDPINTEDKKPEMPSDIHKTGDPKKKKKRKKKRRNR